MMHSFKSSFKAFRATADDDNWDDFFHFDLEPWSANLNTICFAGFGTDRLRRQEAMKTAGKENPNRCTTTRQPAELLERKLEPSLLNQAGSKARKHPAVAKYFFLTFPFIRTYRHDDRTETVRVDRK